MSLVPARYNFTIYQGATFYKRVYFEVENKLQDISGYEAKLIIKSEPTKTLLLELTSAPGGGITLGGILGTIDLEISAAKTSELKWESSVYELFITDLIPRTDVLMRGGFKVIPF
jgi:hypothetical protein